MKLNTNSNVYTIVYASVTVIVVAFLLAFVSLALHETQQKNIDNDKRSQILAAIGQRGIASDQVEAAFDKAVLRQLVLNAKGDSVGNDAFSIENKAITDDNLPLYICQTGTDTLYVIPLTGRGLWGGLWGYISLKSDFQTVAGAHFSHESETAGLGARIVEEDFQNKFVGKKAFADTDFSEVVLSVTKKVENPASDVDAITGATLTSNGVHNMLRDCIARYQQYFKAHTNK